MRLAKFALFLLLIRSGGPSTPTRDWWETATFYEIYPRSFQDSDGDGIGDLRGITSRLSYFTDISVDAIWITPFFTSPMLDFGYDISDFYGIQPEYGTMEDFEELVREAHSLGIRVILDFVPNHSSDQHEWFVKSVAGDPYYRDFYIWNAGQVVNGTRVPPSNWLSVFRGSAWTWHEGRQAFYLHQFLREQPDLNFRNPQVVKAMKDIFWFWLEKGADGFRIDAIPHLFEMAPNSEGRLPDEPESGSTSDPADYEFLQHLYSRDLPETVEMVYQLRVLLDQFQAEKGGATKIMMTEATSDLKVVMQYYGNATTQGAHIPFNFNLLKLTRQSNAEDIKHKVDVWMENMPSNRLPNWILGNHDDSRIGSKLGPDRIDMANLLMLSLSGASISYYGEEIGMTNVFVTWEQTQDPVGLKTDSSFYLNISRDKARTPFQWDSSTSAGFSSKPEPWLPLSPDFREVNVKAQLETPVNSHLKVFSRLAELRRTPTMMYGSLETMVLNRNVFMVLRRLEGHPAYITLLNYRDDEETVDLTAFSEALQFAVVATNSLHQEEERVGDLSRVVLRPKESFVLKEVTT